jgi:serine protease
VAAVTDMFGQTTRHGVRFSVVDAPPTVDIVAPTNNTERYTDEQFSLTAHTYDPDTYGPVADDNVLWTIRNAQGQTKWTGHGHERTVAASALGEGEFEVTVAATDDGGTAKDVTKIRVIKLPPGVSKPSVYILQPEATLDLSSYNGQEQAIELEGHAYDSIDGAVAGTRFRWTAESDQHTKITICSGSAVPGSGNGGGFAIKKDCRNTTAHLGLDGGSAATWTIRLEVWNAAGYKGNASELTVKIHFVTG